MSFFCLSGQDKKSNTKKKYPSWKDNYYKYSSNNPVISAKKLFRLQATPSDTTLPVDKLKGVEIINANGAFLTYISESIKDLQSLKSLNLTWTHLNYFPKVVFKMPQLICLDLAFRNSSVIVDTLTHNFSMLPNLELLSLISCKLNDVPDQVTRMRRLKYLDLSQNSIEILSDSIGKLDSLIDLDLSQNKIDHLPGNLRNLKYLENLSLNNNQLTSFPLIIFKLSNLQELDLRNNDIRTLPQDLLQLGNIRILKINNNPNLYISSEFAQQLNKGCPALEKIFLDGTTYRNYEITEFKKIFTSRITFFRND